MMGKKIPRVTSTGLTHTQIQITHMDYNTSQALRKEGKDIIADMFSDILPMTRVAAKSEAKPPIQATADTSVIRYQSFEAPPANTLTKGRLPKKVIKQRSLPNDAPVDLDFNRVGNVVLHHHNACALVRHFVGTSLAYNEVSGENEVVSRLQWRNEVQSLVRAWGSSDTSKLTRLINHVYGAAFTQRGIREAVCAIAEDNVINPLADVARHLAKEWDGTARLSTWLRDYLNVKIHNRNRLYVAEVGKRWLMGVAARVLMPGCKRDDTLSLVSPQGYGKSEFAKSLARVFPGKTYTNFVGDLRDKDSRAALRGVVIMEFAELDGLTKHDINTIKAYLTTDEDKFRPAYKEEDRSFQRTVSFVATTNMEQFLKDPTGNRRFLPVVVTAPIDIDKFNRVVKQLMGEAATYVLNKEPWNITDPLALAQAEDVRDDHIIQDPWDGHIMSALEALLGTNICKCIGGASYCKNCGLHRDECKCPPGLFRCKRCLGTKALSNRNEEYVAVPDILLAAGLPTARHNAREFTKVATVLKRLGFVSERIPVGKGVFRQKLSVWRPPVLVADLADRSCLSCNNFFDKSVAGADTCECGISSMIINDPIVTASLCGDYELHI